MKKLDDAIKFATDAHSGQKRKLTYSPYILHPLEAAAIAATLTSDEDVICAVVLHDTVEDTEVKITEIREKFGDRVAELVAEETENKRRDLLPEVTWQIRKEETIQRLMDTKDKDVKILWLADKLSNVRSICGAYLEIGDAVWENFNQKDKNLQKWYYKSVAKALEPDFKNTQAFKEYENILNFIFG